MLAWRLPARTAAVGRQIRERDLRTVQRRSLTLTPQRERAVPETAPDRGSSQLLARGDGRTILREAQNLGLIDRERHALLEHSAPFTRCRRWARLRHRGDRV